MPVRDRDAPDEVDEMADAKWSRLEMPADGVDEIDKRCGVETSR